MLPAHNPLYDRDDPGEFLHACTGPFDDRCFFEIVQRVNGYRQYGAANASNADGGASRTPVGVAKIKIALIRQTR